MNEDGQARYEETMRGYLKQRLSRAQVLKAAGIAAAAAAVPSMASAATTSTGGTSPSTPANGLSFPFYPQVPGTYTPENIGDILNIAQTAEHLAVTFLTAGLNNASTIGLSGLTLEIVQAVLVEEIAHVQFLAAAGAMPLTDSFSVPDPKMLSDFNTFFNTLEVADTLFNAAYMTATREFAELGQPTLAKIAYQTGSVEAEHRVLARATLALRGVAADIPPNNKAFETDLFVYVRDAATALNDLGFLGTGTIKASFPGLSTALAAAGSAAQAGVIQKQPNNATSSLRGTDNLTGERA